MLDRLKSKLWIDALRRSVELHGDYAVIARHGDDSAGQIFIRVISRDGREALIGQAMSMTGDRQWRVLCPFETQSASIQDLLDREASRDPDCWIIDVETRAIELYLREPLMGELGE